MFCEFKSRSKSETIVKTGCHRTRYEPASFTPFIHRFSRICLLLFAIHGIEVEGFDDDFAGNVVSSSFLGHDCMPEAIARVSILVRRKTLWMMAMSLAMVCEQIARRQQWQLSRQCHTPPRKGSNRTKPLKHHWKYCSHIVRHEHDVMRID